MSLAVRAPRSRCHRTLKSGQGGTLQNRPLRVAGGQYPVVLLTVSSPILERPAAGPVEPVGGASVRAVQGPVGDALLAFSTGPAGSIGQGAATRPRRIA